MKKKNFSPLLIICFNRPLKVKNLIKIISQNSKSFNKVYFKIDGPKNTQDKIKINQIISQIINLKKKKYFKVFMKIEKNNQGLQKNIISGINWAFKKNKELIILEDDNIPSPSFFKFCNKMLSLYRNNKNIMHISGTSFLKNRKIDDYYFSKILDCVGWATWKSSWNKLIKKFNLNEVLDKKQFKNYFNTNEEKLWFSHYLFREVNSNDGKNLWTTWWVLTLILNHGLSINPSKNLVFHDGYNFEDSPEHFNRKAFIKKKFKIQKIEVKNLQKKPIKYSQFFDNEHFKIIKKIDPHFEILNLLKWKFKMFLRNSFYKKNFQSAKIKL